MSAIEGLLKRWDYKHPTLIHAALGYASIGLRVIPLLSQNKKPRIQAWADRATSDPNQIIAWFEEWPDSNVGIVMGDGVIALDIDTKNGGQDSYRSLRDRLERTPTAEAITGSGGRHYLFRVWQGARIRNITGLLPGVDIKSDRGYIVAYPSVHPDTGKDYVWLSEPCRGIADAPDWLMKMIRERSKTGEFEAPAAVPLPADRVGWKPELVAEVVSRFPVTAYGQRNGQMVRAIGRLFSRRYDSALIASVMRGWWDHFEARGVIRTPPEEAPREIWNCIHSTQASKTFRQAVGRDHRSEWAKVQVSREIEEFIRNAEVEGGEGESNTLILPYSIRVKDRKNQKLCRTKREVAFVEAMVVYFTYKTRLLNETPLKITRSDLCLLMQDSYGLTFDNRQHEDNKRKYVSRPDKPATRYELAVQVQEGHQGSASVYELTGLKQLLPPEAV